MIMGLEIPSWNLIYIELFVNIVDNHNVELIHIESCRHESRKQDLDAFHPTFIYAINLQSFSCIIQNVLDTSRTFLLVSTQPIASADTNNPYRAVQAPCGYVGRASSIHTSLTKDYFHQTPSFPP
jgi:hypothetical protein